MFLVRLLYMLQQVDSRLAEIERELQSLDDGSKLEARLGEHKTVIEDLRERIRVVRRDVMDLELALKGVEGKLEELKEKMRSGAVRNPREVVRIEAEMRELSRQKDEIETRALQGYEELDMLQAKLNSEEEEHKRMSEELNAVKRNYEERLSQLHSERERLIDRRRQLVSQIDSGVLERYERLKERKGGIAVAAIDGTLCGVCKVTLTASAWREIDNPEALPTCENCGRIVCPPPELWGENE
ncbi:MAG: C4-type zinc ribbon domain-containing protein [Armatimonadetes bacterium]|nr:C4-type zinc ribbon domain-containing protein [Armatimonadota bacterium]